MHALVVLVLSRSELLRDVLRAWDKAGAPGATVLESTGIGRVSNLFGRDDLPIIPSLRDLSESRQAVHNTIFSVVDSEAMVDKLVRATEDVVGDLSVRDVGILFVVPLARVVGFRPTR